MSNDEAESDELPENITIPRDLQFPARAFADEESARLAINKLQSILSVISQYIDLADPEGHRTS